MPQRHLQGAARKEVSCERRGRLAGCRDGQRLSHVPSEAPGVVQRQLCGRLRRRRRPVFGRSSPWSPANNSGRELVMRYDAGWTRTRAAPRRTVGARCGWTTRQPTVGPTTGTKVINRVCHISMVCERACEKRRRRYAEGAEEKVCVRNPLWPAHPHPGGFLLLHCNCYILRCRCMHRATHNAPAHSAVVPRSTSHPPQTAQHTRSMQHSTKTEQRVARARTAHSPGRPSLARTLFVVLATLSVTHQWTSCPGRPGRKKRSWNE
eukprot:scaffold39745_cov65-Phaeocystis_antarctica.AAC.4